MFICGPCVRRRCICCLAFVHVFVLVFLRHMLCFIPKAKLNKCSSCSGLIMIFYPYSHSLRWKYIRLLFASIVQFSCLLFVNIVSYKTNTIVSRFYPPPVNPGSIVRHVGKQPYNSVTCAGVGSRSRTVYPLWSVPQGFPRVASYSQHVPRQFGCPWCLGTIFFLLWFVFYSHEGVEIWWFFRLLT